MWTVLQSRPTVTITVSREVWFRYICRSVWQTSGNVMSLTNGMFPDQQYRGPEVHMNSVPAHPGNDPTNCLDDKS